MISFDTQRAVVIVEEEGSRREIPFDTAEAFALASDVWLRVGWDTKHVYTFSWLGRPIIQLPEDMFRVQEVISRLRPDVVIETGVAHGGSLVFYASLMEAMGHGRVVGVDIEIRPHNRAAIEGHELSHRITLIEGSSTEPSIVKQVHEHVSPGDTVLVLLDSNHTRDHVRAELEAYSPMASVGSYVVAADGIMQNVVGAPRTADDWTWNNPQQAVRDFVAEHDEFVHEPPGFEFSESPLTAAVTYWPGGWLRRVR